RDERRGVLVEVTMVLSGYHCLANSGHRRPWWAWLAYRPKGLGTVCMLPRVLTRLLSNRSLPDLRWRWNSVSLPSASMVRQASALSLASSPGVRKFGTLQRSV